MALLLARARFPGKGLLAGALVLPLVLPPTVLGYYLLQILGRRTPRWATGLSRLWVSPLFSTGRAPSWHRQWRRFHFSCLPARGAFEAIDPALEDVARLLGRGEWSVFVAVTFPLAWRGLAAGHRAGICAGAGRFWRDVDGCRQHPRPHSNGRHWRSTTPCRSAIAARAGWLTFLISAVSIVALVVVQRTLPRQGLAR